MVNTVTTKIWFSDGMSYTWPEQQAGVGTTVGVCFPGGGTRAMSAAMGQLRALVNLGLISLVDYISCISGGSWASAPFVYYNTGAANDDEFLGPITAPGDITASGLDVLSESCVGYGATQSFDDALWRAHEAKVGPDMLWIDAVGQLFFERYGLYTRGEAAYFTLDAETQQDIVSRNPSLEGATFNLVRTPGYGLPYLLVNATVDGPTYPGAYTPIRW